jgi:hypothetical protein
MTKQKIFVAYDHDKDTASKDQLLRWDRAEEYDFSFYDRSPRSVVDGDGATAVKRDLTALIANSTHFLCLVGKETYRSAWAAWEAGKAIELKKKIVAVKTDSINNSPPSLQGVGASWSTMFNFDSIKKAIDGA